jgi:ELWxxDGT repeat protein
MVGVMIPLLAAFAEKAAAQEPYLVKEIRPGQNSDVRGFTWFKGEVYFSAVGPGVGAELFKTDGTEAGTVLIKDIGPGGGSFPEGLTVVGDLLFFRADPSLAVAGDDALWRSDGTTEGTVKAYNVNPEPGFGSSPNALVEFGGLLYYSARIGDLGSGGRNEFWRTDGTEEGSAPITDLGGTTLRDPVSPTVVGDRLYFEARLVNTDPQLWILEEASTVAFPVESATSAGPVPILVGAEDIANVGGSVIFPALDDFDTPDLELWRSDGTPEGTFPITSDIPEDPSAILEVVVVGDLIFFDALDDGGDRELWVTDGTLAGSHRVRDINTTGSSDPENLTAAGNLLFLTAEDESGDVELWKSDGTEDGTVRVTDINPGDSSDPESLESVGSLVFFSAEDETGERHLWRSDGTEAGTRRLRRTNTEASSNPANLANIRGRLYFRAFIDTENGSRSDLHALDVATPHVANLSTRGFVGTGDNVMIAGIIIEDGPKEVLIRVLGPSLDGFGVPNTLSDPNVQIFSGATQIASNDDWRTTQETEIEATGLAPGFDVESALVLELEEGAYTAIVSGGIGNALVELFELH